MSYDIYTDGSYSQYDLSSGYGVFSANLQLCACGEGRNVCSSTRAEYYAVQKALERVLAFEGTIESITIFTDFSGILDDLSRWNSGIRTHRLDKICGLLCQCEEKGIHSTFRKVRAHSGVPGNEIADELATAGRARETQTNRFNFRGVVKSLATSYGVHAYSPDLQSTMSNSESRSPPNISCDVGLEVISALELPCGSPVEICHRTEYDSNISPADSNRGPSQSLVVSQCGVVGQGLDLNSQSLQDAPLYGASASHPRITNICTNVIPPLDIAQEELKKQGLGLHSSNGTPVEPENIRAGVLLGFDKPLMMAPKYPCSNTTSRYKQDQAAKNLRNGPDDYITVDCTAFPLMATLLDFLSWSFFGTYSIDPLCLK